MYPTALEEGDTLRERQEAACGWLLGGILGTDFGCAAAPDDAYVRAVIRIPDTAWVFGGSDEHEGSYRLRVIDSPAIGSRRDVIPL